MESVLAHCCAQDLRRSSNGSAQWVPHEAASPILERKERDSYPVTSASSYRAWCLELGPLV